jgi:hypothetical protein
MNKVTRIFLLLTCALCLSVLANAAQPGESRPAGGVSDSAVPPVSSPEEEFANYIAEKNRDAELPDLEYWGIQGAEWGLPPGEVAAKDDGQLFGLGYRQTYGFDGGKGGLNTVKRFFADQAKGKGEKRNAERMERLSSYQQIKKSLMQKYGYPTHPYHPDPDTAASDNDDYVQGRSPRYHVEWHGAETIVSLHLSDAALVLEFREAPPAQAALKRERAKSGAKALKALQEHTPTGRPKD